MKIQVIQHGGMLAATRLMPDGASATAPWEDVTVEQYRAYLAARNTTVPPEITRRQFFRALYQINPAFTKDFLRAQLSQYEHIVDFEDALHFRRDNLLLIAMAAGLGFTSADLDNLFVLGAAIE